jgi:hypothetical protein
MRDAARRDEYEGTPVGVWTTEEEAAELLRIPAREIGVLHSIGFPRVEREDGTTEVPFPQALAWSLYTFRVQEAGDPVGHTSVAVAMAWYLESREDLCGPAGGTPYGGEW